MQVRIGASPLRLRAGEDTAMAMYTCTYAGERTKPQAGGGDYQSLINEALREHIVRGS